MKQFLSVLCIILLANSSFLISMDRKIPTSQKEETRLTLLPGDIRGMIGEYTFSYALADVKNEFATRTSLADAFKLMAINLQKLGPGSQKQNFIKAMIQGIIERQVERKKWTLNNALVVAVDSNAGVDVAQALLDAGADQNAQNINVPDRPTNKDYVILIAVARGDFATFGLLWERGARLDVKNIHGDDIHAYARNFEKEYIFRDMAPVEVRDAITDKHKLEDALKLINGIFKFNLFGSHTREDFIKAMVDGIRARHWTLNSALVVAVDSSAGVDVVRALLDAGADPNAQNINVPDRKTNSDYVILIAVARGDVPTYELLRDRGARLDVRNIHGLDIKGYARDFKTDYLFKGQL